MPYIIPTIREIIAQNIANLEGKLNQKVPLLDKAFIRVLATMEALSTIGLYRFGADRALQNFVLTSSDTELDDKGREYGLPRRAAVAAQLNIIVPVDTTLGPVTIPYRSIWIGDANGMRYYSNQAYIADVGTEIEITITAETSGAVGNLNDDETLTIGTPIAKVGSTATVESTEVLGVDRENDDVYRQRLLDKIQSLGGGGNAADYRNWAQEAPGVLRAFPFAGIKYYDLPFEDGDMEDPTTAAWYAGAAATLTKEVASPHSGVRNLKIARNGVNNPFAYQAPLTVGMGYKISGYYRSDTVAIPFIRNVEYKWEGGLGAGWEYFEINLIASANVISFGCFATAPGEYVEFDDIEIEQIVSPGDRVIYIEATPDIDPDGLAPQTLLDSVREYVTTDQTTLQHRPALGDIDETLYIESIRRTSIYVTIRDLLVPNGQIYLCKTDIQTRLVEYLAEIVPYVDGLDAESSRKDTISDLSISAIVQDVLQTYGATAAGIGFGTSTGIYLNTYTIDQDELLKLGIINYE